MYVPITLQIITLQFSVSVTCFGDDEHTLTVPQPPSSHIWPFQSPSLFLFRPEDWLDWQMLCAGDSGSTDNLEGSPFPSSGALSIAA